MLDMEQVGAILWRVIQPLVRQWAARATHPPHGAGEVDGMVRLDSRLPWKPPASALGERELDRLARTLDDRLWPERAGLSQVPENEVEAAVQAVVDALAAASPIDDRLAFSVDLSARMLREHVRGRATEVAGIGLSDAGVAVYERLLMHCCEHLVEWVTSRPWFSERAQVETIRRLRELRGGVEELLVRTSTTEAVDRLAFENRYSEAVVGELDRIALFGLSMSSGSYKQYPLTTAYVSLAVAREAPGGGHDMPVRGGSGLSVQLALAGSRRVLLRGVAGSGKTTLLQWLAVSAARRSFGPELADWNERVPFLLPLRQYVARTSTNDQPARATLPQPESFPRSVADIIAGEAPHGWVRQVLAEGGGLVLLDGVDELPERLRPDAQKWLGGMIRAFPDARYVVTSRPSAIDKDWLSREGFVEYDLLPMSLTQTRGFVGHWHDAAREEHPDDRDRLRQHEMAILDALASQPQLGRLATNPLLCALLCALNHDREMHLPRSRKELYDAALEMLLIRRDRERQIGAPEGIELSLDETIELLQRLAYWMVRNGLAVAPSVGVGGRGGVLDRIADTLRALPHVAEPPDRIYRHLLLRTGLLREPTDGSVEFVHRTFQDYLAAKALVAEGDLPLLLQNADKDEWHDIVVMAVAHARPRERDELLRSLIDQGRRRPETRRRMHLLAAAGLNVATSITDHRLSDEVRECTANLLPPRSVDDAEELGKAGEFILGLLDGPETLGEDEAAATIRAASLCAGPPALSFLIRFGGDQRPAAVRELIRAWPLFDAEDYATQILGGLRLHDHVVTVSNVAQLRALRFLHDVRDLVCSGDLADLSSLALLGQAERLTISHNPRLEDLGPVAALGGLTSVALISCGGLWNLTPLSESSVSELSLVGVEHANLRTLQGMAALRRLHLDHAGTEPALIELPDGLGVTNLSLGPGQRETRLAGIERLRSLRQLDITFWPNVDSFISLRAVPGLATLRIHRTAIPDLGPLAALESLRVVELRECVLPDDLSPLARARRISRVLIEDAASASGRPFDLAPLNGQVEVRVQSRRSPGADDAAYPSGRRRS